MCIGVPCRVVEILDDERALVEAGEARRMISLHLMDDISVGDYVLVHAGFAVNKLREEEALETMKLLEAYFGGEIIEDQ